MRVFPANRKRLVDLDILTGFDAAATENALVGVVPIERIRRIHRESFWFEGGFLMLDGQEFGGVVNRAVAVIVVADRTVEQVVAQDSVEGLPPGSKRVVGFRRNVHAVGDLSGASPDEVSVDLDHAGIAGLERAELRVITDLRNLNICLIEKIDEPDAGFGIYKCAVDTNPSHHWFSSKLRARHSLFVRQRSSLSGDS
jgi:hypothetical protein